MALCAQCGDEMTELCEGCNRKMCTICGCTVCNGEDDGEADEEELFDDDAEDDEEDEEKKTDDDKE